MDPIICSRRTSIAQDNIDAAAKLLAEKIGVSAPVAAFDREPSVMLMNRMEAIAEFLNGLVAADVAPVVESVSLADMTSTLLSQIAEIDGIGEATMTKIRNGLAAQGVVIGSVEQTGGNDGTPDPVQ